MTQKLDNDASATSGVARFGGARGQQSQWPTLTEIMNTKKLKIIY
jgi:hypothetical protein